jgi:hypothetical protein
MARRLAGSGQEQVHICWCGTVFHAVLCEHGHCHGAAAGASGFTVPPPAGASGAYQQLHVICRHDGHNLALLGWPAPLLLLLLLSILLRLLISPTLLPARLLLLPAYRPVAHVVHGLQRCALLLQLLQPLRHHRLFQGPVEGRAGQHVLCDDRWQATKHSTLCMLFSSVLRCA